MLLEPLVEETPLLYKKGKKRAITVTVAELILFTATLVAKKAQNSDQSAVVFRC
jgi:hypothetical protein